MASLCLRPSAPTRVAKWRQPVVNASEGTAVSMLEFEPCYNLCWNASSTLHNESQTLIMLAMKRGYSNLLESYLTTFPCVALLGVRQCGKTTLLQTLPAGWKQFDLERRADHAVISHDPDTFFRLNPRQVALDEAQVLPEIFPALRLAIDERRAGWSNTSRPICIAT